MALSIDEIRRIALLARLRLDEDEEVRLAAELNEIVSYIDQLQQFSEAPPEASGEGGSEADDVPRDSLDFETLLSNAPAALDRFLLVPQVKPSDVE